MSKENSSRSQNLSHQLQDLYLLRFFQELDLVLGRHAQSHPMHHLEKKCHWNPMKMGDHSPISIYEFLRLIYERHQTQLSKPFRAWI